MRPSVLFALSLACAACVGQTGGDVVTFPVAAAGPADAAAGQPLAFPTDLGWDVTLTQATLHVGAVYLNQSRSVSGGQATGCYANGAGTYVAEETSPLDVDLLSPAPQQFPAPALGISEPPPLVGEVWLTGGDVNARDDETPIFVIAGTATQNGATIPFTGTLTIGANRQTSSSGPAGGDPICKKRIVSQIPAAFTLQRSGGLLLRIDPRPLFTNIDFAALPADAATGGFAFRDNPSAPGYQPTGQNLFTNLHSTAPYAFSWTDAL
jgi:hypothetical protein